MLDYVNPDHPSSFHRLNGLVYWNRHGGNWARQMNSFNSSVFTKQSLTEFSSVKIIQLSPLTNQIDYKEKFVFLILKVKVK